MPDAGASRRDDPALFALLWPIFCSNKRAMDIVFDQAKRDATLENRGLDMARAGEVFDGTTLTAEDDRRDYGETRFITVGHLDGRMVFVAWTPRGPARRIISMRKANEREQRKYRPFFGTR